MRTGFPVLMGGLLFLLGQWAAASESRYQMYDDEGEVMGSVASQVSKNHEGIVVQTRFNMQGERMFIHFSMQGEDRVVLGDEGIREFELYDEIKASLYSFKRTTRGRFSGDELVLEVTEKDKEPDTRTYKLSDFDTISRLNTRNRKAYAQLLRSAPVTLRSLNLMMGKIEEIYITPDGETSVTLNGEEMVVEKYLIQQRQGDSEVWLLPDGRIYRQGSKFGYMLLQADEGPDLGW